MVVRVIDIETTGMDPSKDAIIEIASIDLVNGGGVANARSTNVAPGRPVPPLASAVHHITDEDLRDAPPFGRGAADVHGSRRLRGAQL